MLDAFIRFWKQSFKHRLIGAGILFLFPLLFISFNLVKEQQKDIKIAQMEIEGAKKIKIASDFKIKLITEIKNQKNNNRNKRSYVPELEQLSAENKDINTKNSTKSAISGLLIAIREFEKSENFDKLKADTVYNASNHLINNIAIEYGLILDSDLPTYTLIDFSIIKSMNLMDVFFEFYENQLAKESKNNENFILGKVNILSLEFSQAGFSALNAGKKEEYYVEFTHLLNNSNNIFAKIRNQNQIEDISIIDKSYENLVFISQKSQDFLRIALEQRLKNLYFNQILVLGSALLLFGGAFLLVYFNLQRGIIYPINRLTNSMENVSLGDYDTQLNGENRQDEVGAMMRALKKLRDNSVARELAESATKAKAEFLAVMSHEIRTPMNGVLGMAQALKASKLENEQTEMVNIIIDSGQSMLSLLNDILDMSKIEANKIDLENIKMSPCAIIKGTLSLFENQAGDRIKLSHKIDENAQGWYYGDPNRIRQILNNFVSNALKFTSKGEVSIELKQVEKNRLQFNVKDTGIGIPKDKLNLLFEKFTQLDSSHSRIYGGTGLGLSICAGLIKAMGGKLWVESNEDIGSVFSFEIEAQEDISPENIPCDKCEKCTNQNCIDAQFDKNIRGDLISKDDENLSILIAEDNEINRIVIKTLLAPLNIIPDFAENGKIAFEMWQNKFYNVVLMDVQMPVWDGLLTMREMRKWENTYRRPHTAIVALSANAMRNQIEDQINAGADTYSSKPIMLEKLLSAIEEAIAISENYNLTNGLVPIRAQ